MLDYLLITCNKGKMVIFVNPMSDKGVYLIKVSSYSVLKNYVESTLIVTFNDSEFKGQKIYLRYL